MEQETGREEAAEAADFVFTAQFNDIARDVWPEALRFVLDRDRAHERCDRRACRVTGCCRLSLVEGAPVDCGAGVSRQVVRDASDFAMFATVLLLRNLLGYDGSRRRRSLRRG